MNAASVLRAAFFGFAWQTVGWCADLVASLALKIEVTHTLSLGKPVEHWEWSYLSPHFFKTTTLETKDILIEVSGTAWATEFNGKRILVTAGHVIGTFGKIDPVLDKKTDAGFYPISRRTSVVLGSVGGRPNEIGVFKAGSLEVSKDVALMTPDSDAVFAGLQVFKLADRLPSLLEAVRAIGFPHTTFTKVEDTAVVAVMGPAGFFVLNKRLDPGFSGGVVIDAEGRALGVITSVESGNTTVFTINRKMLERFEFTNAQRLLMMRYPHATP